MALHPSILPRLDPEYIAFHNEKLINVPPTHLLPWDPSIRNGPPIPGASEPREVASIQDYSLSHCKLRAYTPKGSVPPLGWPALLYYHGGGWTLGNINTETTFATFVVEHTKCVVLSVDYRLAPENPHPAAVDDALEALHWLNNSGWQPLNIDVARIAVGGSSSGGNLAAIVALKAAELAPPIPLVFQLLIVPVIDNTATTSGPYLSWSENEHTPWLSPARMLWFRDNYLPEGIDRTKWDNSPIFAPESLLRNVPAAWIALCELDILRDEGITYGDKLKEAGVPVEMKIYPRAPHPIMAMDGYDFIFIRVRKPRLTLMMYDRALSIGRQLVNDAAVALAQGFANGQ